MKLLTLIMSFYIVALSYMPCGDCDTCDHDLLKTEIGSTTDTDDEEHTQEICSPFCMCACCLGFEVASRLTFIETPFSYKETLYTIYNISLTNHSLFDIWQPPKTV